MGSNPAQSPNVSPIGTQAFRFGGNDDKPVISRGNDNVQQAEGSDEQLQYTNGDLNSPDNDQIVVETDDGTYDEINGSEANLNLQKQDLETAGMDLDNDEYVTEREFNTYYKYGVSKGWFSGDDATYQTHLKNFRAMDTSGGGMVSRQEYNNAGRGGAAAYNEQYNHLTPGIDTDNNGFGDGVVSQAEAASATSNGRTSQPIVDRINGFAAYDTDGDGNLSELEITEGVNSDPALANLSIKTKGGIAAALGGARAMHTSNHPNSPIFHENGDVSSSFFIGLNSLLHNPTTTTDAP